jgi:hypothetical protein
MRQRLNLFGGVHVGAYAIWLMVLPLKIPSKFMKVVVFCDSIFWR